LGRLTRLGVVANIPQVESHEWEGAQSSESMKTPQENALQQQTCGAGWFLVGVFEL